MTEPMEGLLGIANRSATVRTDYVQIGNEYSVAFPLPLTSEVYDATL